MKRRLAWFGWAALSAAAIFVIAGRLQSTDRSVFLPGETTSGHYQIELSCDACHTPYMGVQQSACVKCHQQELDEAEDSHPRSKFTDPRNADRIALLDALQCITCHTEHRPQITSVMGVTQPLDHCFYCHSEIAQERPSHEGMQFNTCASAGCHNFHDNRALYEDFLLKHQNEPETLSIARVVAKAGGTDSPDRALAAGEADGPPSGSNPAHARAVADWAATAHARAGVNCTACHNVADSSGRAVWQDHPGYQSCRNCHAVEAAGFQSGRHGMRLASGLTPMSPALGRLPMKTDAMERTVECTACHRSHEFDRRDAAVDACLMCHNDKHSLAYKASPHFALWRAETGGDGAAGSGVSCATCHMPRETRRQNDMEVLHVQHNQNANLRPNEKMLRSVCMQCHGLAFSIDSLADPALIQNNFSGRPAQHIRSIDMAVEKAAGK